MWKAKPNMHESQQEFRRWPPDPGHRLYLIRNVLPEQREWRVVLRCARTDDSTQCKTKSWDRVPRRGTNGSPAQKRTFPKARSPEEYSKKMKEGTGDRKSGRAQCVQGRRTAMWNPRPISQEGANPESPRTFHLLTFQCSSHSGRHYFSPTESPIINAKMPSNTTTTTMIIINFWRG